MLILASLEYSRYSLPIIWEAVQQIEGIDLNDLYHASSNRIIYLFILLLFLLLVTAKWALPYLCTRPSTPSICICQKKGGSISFMTHPT